MPKKTKLKNSNKMDMINGPIWNKLPRFALPVAATAILEQLFNASDIAVVGNFTGAAKTASVAAVGANSPVIGLILNLFIGIALGTNVIIANAIGRDDRETVQRAVHTSVLTAIIGGFLVMIPGEIFAVQILSVMSIPEDVLPYAVLYLRIYLLGLPVILLYNFLSAVFRSVGDTKTPLIVLALSGCLNVLLNLFFVIVLKMTVNGVAIDEPYLAEGAVPSTTPFSVVVPEGSYWMMGDNRQRSADSEYHLENGQNPFIPEGSVIGRAQWEIWPLSDWSYLGNRDVFASVPDPQDAS